MQDKIIEAIENTFTSKGYKFFKDGKYNLNIFSIRSKGRAANKFDDFIYCVYKDNLSQWRLHQWRCTTDPGTYWLKNPSRVEGTAILASGQYRGVYKIDKHAGKYSALCQRNGAVTVYRDSNKDKTIDILPESKMSGLFGINIHKAGNDSKQVDKWSAGCTVFKRAKDFEAFMIICRKSKRTWGNSFTYTLFE